MKITPDIISYEFIGTQTHVAQSSHTGYLGISGRIVDETKKTFLIQDGNETKRIVKDVTVFHFTFSDGTVVEIDGKLLVGKPEDRLKKTIKRLW
ncbi:MAG: ribonuclease P protein component 1 [Candidatus Bathyarchaeota archaeon]|nr:ribonuclease P protein component 1 [Candidatus Bathyarchaeota archaeon]